MKNFFISLLVFAFVTLGVFADSIQEAKNFFNNYMNAANTYSDTLSSMYSPNAKIIRQVVKPDGTLVDVYTDTSTYIKQMKLAQATAKLRKYKNEYRNISVAPYGGGYKISAERQPSGETYWLKTHQVIKKQANGKWLITEEMMQTKQQIFLKYAK